MINLFKVYMPPEVDAPLLEVLHSGYITQGKKVDEFEEKFEKVLGVRNAVSLNSCTSALTLALRVADVVADDEVITTPMTCTATNLPILSLGATPVFADINPETGLIDPEDVKRKITDKTRAIMAVDWGGAPVDVKALMAIAEEHGIKLIVDAAHALGTRHNAEPDFTCYSLQAIKHITTGDGGVLLCKDDNDKHRAKVLRWFGIDREAPSKDTRIDQDIVEWGYKFHMNDITATIGIVQLDHIARVVKAHQVNAAYLSNELSPNFRKPSFEGAFWLYTIQLPNQEYRQSFKEWMEAHDIQVSQVHKRNDEYTVFRPFAQDNCLREDCPAGQPDYHTHQKVFPGVDGFANTMICIPVHHGLSFDDLHHIVQTANAFWEQQK